MRRLLVLSYYFPPAVMASAGYRASRLVKHLSNWSVTVVSGSGTFGARDPSLGEDLPSSATVVRVPDPVPLGAVQGGGRRRFARSLVWPDGRLLWAVRAYRTARALCASHAFDACLALCPPFSTALAAERLCRSRRLPLVLDVADPWADDIYGRDTPLHRSLSRCAQERVVSRASLVVAVNEPIARSLSPSARVITHGFDRDLTPSAAPEEDGRLTVAHLGSLFGAHKDPAPLLEGLALHVARAPDTPLRLSLVGVMSDGVAGLVSGLKLGGFVSLSGYRPHGRLDLSRTNVLLVLVTPARGWEMVSTSKAFEYAGFGRPVAVVSPDNWLRGTMASAGAYCASPDPASVAALFDALVRDGARKALRRLDGAFVESCDYATLGARYAALIEAATAR